MHKQLYGNGQYTLLAIQSNRGSTLIFSLIVKRSSTSNLNDTSMGQNESYTILCRLTYFHCNRSKK